MFNIIGVLLLIKKAYCDLYILCDTKSSHLSRKQCEI